MGYIGRVFYMLDKFINVLAFGQDETVSSRCGKAVRDKRDCAVCKGICRVLDVFWPGHCVRNIKD